MARAGCRLGTCCFRDYFCPSGSHRNPTTHRQGTQVFSPENTNQALPKRPQICSSSLRGCSCYIMCKDPEPSEAKAGDRWEEPCLCGSRHGSLAFGLLLQSDCVTCLSEASLLAILLKDVFELCPAPGLSVTFAVSLGGFPPVCGLFTAFLLAYKNPPRSLSKQHCHSSNGSSSCHLLNSTCRPSPQLGPIVVQAPQCCATRSKHCLPLYS